jgi:uncharacterized protein (DUF1810 family)
MTDPRDLERFVDAQAAVYPQALAAAADTAPLMTDAASPASAARRETTLVGCLAIRVGSDLGLRIELGIPV